MINLDIENLNDINLILERLEAHDRFIEATIELFEDAEKCDENIDNENIDNENCVIKNKKAIHDIINNKEKKYILSNIINILNYVFPDYEFKYLNNSNYKYIKNLNNVIDNINYNLLYVVENIYRGFNKKVWEILKELMDFKSCDIYTYLNNTDKDPYIDKQSISSFNYFFFAKKTKRILFISCITKPKYKNQNDEDFNNIYMTIQDEPSVNAQNDYDEIDSSSS
ncbi:repressor of RNA polymerase III transcription MAF1, putative [Plasmodium vinckei brucechwatti]|uniref:Repressor of RNA polymerase III transcription MAF1, putative n=1 Tax=Plasmodium vinckei brucechwatti TaxID=119398 RepID=A0A6V7S082_PLAVN|nr:repressor of RNA polymerase III transcription MAF1, putative [Plasmodium vinckei brucechwatti]